MKVEGVIMNQKVEKYLKFAEEIGKLFFENEDEDGNSEEINKLDSEQDKIIDSMSLEELEELKKYVSAREAYHQIKPRIEKLQLKDN